MITIIRQRNPIPVYPRFLTVCQCLRRHASSSEVVTFDPRSEVSESSEEEIAKICNKSRLRPDHYRIYKGEHPEIPDAQKPQYMRTLKWQRKLIGKCGFEGQYDPGICFATKEEIQDLIEYEKVAFDVPILEIRKRELEKLKKMKEERYEREKKISEALTKQKEWKAKIQARVDERSEEAEVAKAERARLLEEVRRYFGYTIDPKDEKFQIVLAVKEREVAKEKKQERKKQKEQQFLAKLASLEVGTGTDSSTSKKKNVDTKETKTND